MYDIYATQYWRLNKFISHSDLCSRRHADVLIKNGTISVNGNITNDLSTIVKNTDIVCYKNQRLIIRQKEFTYILLNKPFNCVTTTYDPQHRHTILDYVKTKERLYSVGRLDRNTTGILLLTNDGSITRFLTHPSSNIKKTYQISIDRAFSISDEKKIKNTIILTDGGFKFDEVIIHHDRTILKVTLHSGRNRIIRRIFEKLGYRIISLDRIEYAGLTLEQLKRGEYRHLTPQEIKKIQTMLKS